ncbi:hypothetical protein V6N11_082575 [Hibiscus sabdariffa]|uniref:Protein kinase domain-containing protein n=1 Tax=Hibiscus sabdariffa TaxID=183260 RepID=A0ABR2N9A1_9ROSI
MSLLALSNPSGALGNVCSFLVKVVVLSCAISITNADFSSNLLQAPAQSPTTEAEGAPAVSDLSSPSNLPFVRRPHRRHFSPRSAPTLLAPALAPLRSPLITASHPPISSRLSKPLMKRSALVPPGVDLPNIAPTQIAPGPISAGLAQPPLAPEVSSCCKPNSILKRGTHGCHCVYPIKLDLLLLNVSQNTDRNAFLVELTSQLDLLSNQIEIINFYMLSLSRLNISMDIIPHTGISFSASDTSKINSSLVMHRVRFDPNVVGDYKILNFTWFEPPAPSPAPVTVSKPRTAPSHQSSNSTSLSSSNKRKHSNLILIFGISAGILVFAIISVLIICSCTFHEGKTKASPKESVKTRTADSVAQAGSFPHPSSTRFLQYEELKEATNNFAASSILGEGGFGRVFKGVLSDGTAVAIKRLTNGGPQGDKEFLVEVEMLSRLHHRNLVKLVGPSGVNCPLDWETRMKIALDAARGLAYLHEDSQPCVIHRDFKASNILLDNNFHAKVADFGLAKQAPEGRTNYQSTRVMGTFGYVAPEYAMTGHLLVKSDVYSYGVVLLELLTGKTPVDMSQSSGQENLVAWARPILRDKDRLEELSDPRLGGKYPKEDFIRVCTIAAACVAPEASQRPTMGEVVQSLKMVQRVTEYQDSASTISNNRPNWRQSSTTFESDETSSVFSSGPVSGFSAFINDNIMRTAVSSEDLHEGR